MSSFHRILPPLQPRPVKRSSTSASPTLVASNDSFCRPKKRVKVQVPVPVPESNGDLNLVNETEGSVVALVLEHIQSLEKNQRQVEQ